jgi:hypothetical protein
VSGGPFEGLRYLAAASDGYLAPKLLGSHEEELHGVVREIVRDSPEVVVNVGCAEGYYAVGMAMALPGSVVFAFDSSVEARRSCLELARLNGVADRIVVGGACTSAILGRLALEGAALICDCEGCERWLLDPETVPGLRRCTLLVELHDCWSPGLTAELLPRFRGTHSVRMITSTPRDPARYPAVRFLSAEDQALALDENRCLTPEGLPQQWAFMRPRPTSLLWSYEGRGPCLLRRSG